MAVNIQKFLPSTKGGALTNTPQSVIKKSSSDVTSESIQNSITIIRVKVVEIDKILKGTLSLSKKKLDDEKRKQSTQRRERQEEKLETKPNLEKSEMKLPKKPKLGIFDWVKNFIGKLILGYFAYRLIDHLPKIIPIIKFIGQATDFVLGVGGDLLNGLVTFVDWGYKAYDFTRNQLKDFGGENFVKVFDAFTGAVDGVVTAALAASFALVDMAGGGSSGPGAGGKPSKNVGRGVFGRGLGRAGTRLGLKTVGKGGVKAAVRILKPLARGIPVIGGLLEFGFALMEGDNVGKAAFKAVGATLFGAVGAALGGPFALFTGAGGAWLGSEAAARLYDYIFGSKKSSQKVAKAAGGGQPVTRGGKLSSGPRRTIKKTETKRQVSTQPTQLKPGANVGGEDKIEKVFPKSEDKTKVSPLDYVENSYKKISEEPFFGPLMSISTKALVGQKPSKVDYKNAAQGLSNWMNITFSDEVLRTGSLYAAGGGEINADMLAKKSGNMTDAIAKSLEDNISKRIDESIDELMKQMMLKQPVEEPDKSDPTIDTEEEIPSGLTKGQWGPLLDLIAGKESGGNYEAMYPSTTLPGATKMTIVEVARRATGAVGKYQQLPQYLVGRARAAGLNPDKDLYSPENQEKIIINVNIKGRGGEKWLRGEISDEQFMQGLSQEFASLPNAQGKFYYSGQRSSMTPEKVKAALSKVKRGGYTPQEIAASEMQQVSGTGRFKVIEYITGDRNHPNLDVPGHGMPSNYHDHIAFATVAEKEKAKRALRAAGIQIGSELRPGDPGYHGRNLAIDIPGAQWGGTGSIGSREFSGSRRVRSVLGIGKNAPRFHGGPILKTGMLLGHEGEYIIDKDSVNLFGFKFIESINSVENRAQLAAKAPSIIEELKKISGYTDYERPEPEVVMVPIPSPIPIGDGYSSQSSGGLAMFASTSASEPFEALYQGT